MDFYISHSSNKPIYEQIMAQIKSQILSGVLKEGDALPSIRVLARELRISVITTKRAYDELEHEGLLHSVAGMRQLEDLLQKAVDSAKEHGFSLEELTRILTLIYQEER